MSEQHPEQGSTAERPAEPMAGDVLQFSLHGEIDKLKTEQEWINNGRNSKTLIKYSDFRVVLTVLRADTRMKEHRTAGRISLQTLSGRIRIHASGNVFELGSGKLLTIDREIPHDVEALEDSAFLITIAWREKE